MHSWSLQPAALREIAPLDLASCRLFLFCVSFFARQARSTRSSDRTELSGKPPPRKNVTTASVTGECLSYMRASKPSASGEQRRNGEAEYRPAAQPAAEEAAKAGQRHEQRRPRARAETKVGRALARQRPSTHGTGIARAQDKGAARAAQRPVQRAACGGVGESRTRGSSR